MEGSDYEVFGRRREEEVEYSERVFATQSFRSILLQTIVFVFKTSVYAQQRRAGNLRVEEKKRLLVSQDRGIVLQVAGGENAESNDR